jgi:hypothetical protein
MPDLIAVAAYGKTQSLSDTECLELFHRLSQLRWEPTLPQLSAITGDIKQERLTGLRDEHQPVMWHDEWKAKR